MINDRGSKKWVAMMLPEHVEMLNQLHDEQSHQSMPQLDEQKFIELSQKISDAVTDNLTVEVAYFKDYGVWTIIGRIEKIDTYTRTLTVHTIMNDTYKIKLDSIVDIEIN